MRDTPTASPDAGDSRKVACQKLSGIASLELSRRAVGVTQVDLARTAGVSLRTYHRLLAGRAKAKPALVAKLTRALTLCGQRAKLNARDGEIILSAWRGFVAELVGPLGAGLHLTIDDVAASDPQRGATADPRWRACRRVSQAGIYLVSTSFDISQRRLAELFDLTPAAVCLALQAVEDMRDNAAFEAALEAAQLKMIGRAVA